jgi:hypothetical protein
MLGQKRASTTNAVNVLTYHNDNARFLRVACNTHLRATQW